MKKFFLLISFFLLIGCSLSNNVTNISPSPKIQTKEEIIEYVTNLLNTNNSCELPCFIGIIPGVSSWNDVKAFFQPFSEIYPHGEEKSKFSTEIFIPRTGKDLILYMRLSITDGYINDLIAGNFFSERFSLSNILIEQGMPTSVFLSASNSDLPPDKFIEPFYLELYYPEKGIIADFSGNATIDNNNIIGCISNIPGLILWDKNNEFPVYLADNRISGEFKKLEEATDMLILDFFEKFKNNKDKPCISTPKDIWHN